METQDKRNDGYEVTRRVAIPSHELESEISLKPLVQVLWNYRRAIAAAMSLVAILATLGLLGVYLFQPVERVARVEFRLLFEGADHDRYPNGLSFSPAEIIGTPVLTRVYETNDLKRYLTYDDFKSGLFVLDSNRELDLLAFEYQSKLADTRLTPVDRSKLEQEFRQKQEALRVPQYTLNFIIRRGLRIPDVLMSKVLNDVLALWAEQAVNTKGVLSYQVRVYSPSVLKKQTGGDDPIIRLDKMRADINRIVSNVDELVRLPGATIMRAGQGKISLPEIRANLEDIREYKVEPLLRLAAMSGVAQDANQVMRYVEGRRNEVKLNEQEALGQARTLQDALSAYMRERQTGGNGRGASGDSQVLVPPGMTMQLSDSFLDRLVALSSQDRDSQFRQGLTEKIIAAGQTAVSVHRDSVYYEELASSVRLLQSKATAGQGDARVSLERTLDETEKLIVGAVQDIGEVYSQLSTQNLNPRASLFTVTGAFIITTQRVLTIGTVAIYILLTTLLTLVLTPFVCLVHHYFKREILQPKLVGTSNEHVEEKARAQLAGYRE